MGHRQCNQDIEICDRPLLRSRKRIGLLHFGQAGGGEFLGMTLTLDQARALPDSLSPINAETGAAIAKACRRLFLAICTVPDSEMESSLIWHVGVGLAADHGFAQGNGFVVGHRSKMPQERLPEKPRSLSGRRLASAA